MPNTFDPLASVRRAGDPEVDVFVQGMVFLDIVFTGLRELPRPGTEVWADGMGSCPGGIANLAVAGSRLGLRTALWAPPSVTTTTATSAGGCCRTRSGSTCRCRGATRTGTRR